MLSRVAALASSFDDSRSAGFYLDADGTIVANVTDQAAADEFRAAGATTRLVGRSLRQLSVSEPRVRAARAESRTRQAERIRGWLTLPKRRSEAVYVALLQIERLADAAAEGELSDLGLADSAAISAIAELIEKLRS